MFEDCTSIFKGYGEVDSILEDCERIGATLRVAIAAWTTPSSPGKGKAKEIDLPPSDEVEDGALSLRSIAPLKEHKPKDYISTQPSLLSDTVQLKEYQLLGVNWLNLLYRSNLSCILADEMGMSFYSYNVDFLIDILGVAGLGKTIQVISFFAHLKERGNKGPHLVVVPYVVVIRSLYRLVLNFLDQFFNPRKLVPGIRPFCAIDINTNILCWKG